MSEDGKPSLSRRAYLAAGVSGMTFLAGCPGTQDAAMATEEPTATATATDEPTESPVETESTDASSDPPEDGEAVLVDQMGYRPSDEKTAVVRTDAESFAVLDTETDAVVTSGELGEPIEDANSRDTVRQADFSDVTEPGNYVLAVDDNTAFSHEFTVDEGVWGRALADIGRHYTLNRANTAIDDSLTGLSLEPGHPQDAEAKIYFSDEFHEKGDTLDVTGGWYDAGDYGKYVPPAAVTVSQMLLAYERNPDTFEPGQFAFPDGISEDEVSAGMPDLLAEAKFELEWLETMQRPDGAVYHKVSGKQWPGFKPPAEDTQDRYVYGLSTYGTAMYAGTMAMAARVYEAFDSAFAERALENAKAAFGFLEETPEPRFRSDDGQNSGSGGYSKHTDAAERFWAGAELLKTTGDSTYADYLESNVASQFEAGITPVSWDNGRLFGHWAYYTAQAGAADRKSQIGEALVEYADSLVEHIETEGYNVSLTEDEYHWASNKIAVGKGNVLLLADEVESNEAYVRGALDQIHYVLGRTPTTNSYVTGAGESACENVHDRIMGATDTVLPGHVVGGPNAEGGDPVLDEYIETENPAPAKCYRDVQGSYSSNEAAIDYAAPLVFALAHVTPADAISPTE